VKLNLGCGDKILPGYVNVDVAPARAGQKPNEARRTCCASSLRTCR
jgi:hypothetical protein